uniref:non-specific serine/threonine protein kinase n=1 Tax=Salix viminalis TaxID=40686 RepID=A0A6N2KNX7_SALVM
MSNLEGMKTLYAFWIGFYIYKKNGDIMEMVDPRLGSAFNKKEVVRMINVALICTNQSPALRPAMSTVVSMLEGKTDVEELVMVPSRLSDQSGYELVNPLCNKFAQASFNGSSKLYRLCRDLWANYLSGNIPPVWVHTKLEFLCIGVNRLTGKIPNYLGKITTLRSLALSANNLSGELPLALANLTRLKALEIEAERYSVHINCGGLATTIEKTTYEADDDLGGAAKYAFTGHDWQKSTTGHFWDVNSSLNNYIAQNMSILRMKKSVLYTNARLTPLSLTYYVPCLANGNYNVKLHFAEIVMRDNRSYYSLGRRNIVVLKDFDIVTKAGGVDKGVLSDGTRIAVKQLSAKSKQGNREFVNEIGMISALQHPNLVRLYGCCIEGKQLLLVYEYMENNSLAHEIEAMKLDWSTRQRICVNIAKGLVFLHEESTLKIVHRDIKGTNILLDKDMNAKISDFGMAKLDDEDNSHIDTRADVYSFGVVALEIVSGMNNVKFRSDENFVCLLDWVLYLQKNGDIMEMVDPRLESAFNKKEVVRMINVALLCTNQSPALRPAMSTVVSMLEGKTDVEELVMVSSRLSDQSGYELVNPLFNKFAQASLNGSSSETKSLGVLSDGTQIAVKQLSAKS